MPRKNPGKGTRRLEAKRRQEREEALNELREEIHRLQAERRRADEEWLEYDADVVGHDEEMSTGVDLSGEDYRPGFEDYDSGWWNGGSDDRRG
jgi:hypothetical protein